MYKICNLLSWIIYTLGMEWYITYHTRQYLIAVGDDICPTAWRPKLQVIGYRMQQTLWCPYSPPTHIRCLLRFHIWGIQLAKQLGEEQSKGLGVTATLTPTKTSNTHMENTFVFEFVPNISYTPWNNHGSGKLSGGWPFSSTNRWFSTSMIISGSVIIFVGGIHTMPPVGNT